MTRRRTDYCISYQKYDDTKLELVVSVYVDNVFMAGRPQTLEKIKEMVNLKPNIQEFGKVKKFLGVDYELGCDAKFPYDKITMEKDVNKFIDGYKKFIGSDEKI